MIRMMKDPGLTLSEVIIGLVIFSTVVVSGLYFFVTGADFIERASRKETGLNIATARIERLRGDDYEDVETSGPFNLNVNGTEYQVSVTVAEDTSENLKEVNVTVSFDDGGREVTLDSIIIH